MSKEVEWSRIRGEGEIVCTCDQCYDNEIKEVKPA